MTGNFVFPRNAFLGFDHIFDALQDIHVHANDGYPPHNVVRDGDNKYIIEMAVAGFNKKDIEIKVKEHILTIKGDRDKRREADAYVHKGISGRKFEKSFILKRLNSVCKCLLIDELQES
jgi:molecular chaperone IbpA